ncbi:MAG: MarR family transcriptional regulator [Clostridia bacterium]|nr:MarR family transcriptional regulator [Clostridia bacterium]
MPKKKPPEAILQHRPPRPPHETPPMIVNDISHLFFGKVRSFEPEGIMSQHSARCILRLLVRGDGIRQNEIAQALHLSAPSVSATLRRMEAEGLIGRSACEGDGRAVRVCLTDKGREYDEGVRSMLRRLDGILMDGFSETETEQLTALLCRMRENLLKNLPSEDGEGEVAQ